MPLVDIITISRDNRDACRARTERRQREAEWKLKGHRAPTQALYSLPLSPLGNISYAKLSYRRFRTGLTYRDVYHMLWKRRFKRRHTVLGKWREIKLALYAQYENEVEETGGGDTNVLA